MVARDIWSKPWDFGHGSEWTGTACRPRRPSEPGPRHPGPLVDPAGTRSLADVARQIWFTPRGLGHGPKSPGRCGHPRVPSGMGPGRLGQLVKSGTSAQNPSRPVDLVDTAGPWAPARVALDSSGHRGPSGTSLRGPGRLVDTAGNPARSRVPGTASRLRGPSGSGPSPPGQLVDTSGPRTRARVPRYSWSKPQALGHECDTPGRAGGHRRP